MIGPTIRRVSRYLVICIFTATEYAHAQAKPDNSLCQACHEPVVAKVEAGAHGAAACAACHTRHEEFPHPANAAPAECKTCHAKQVSEFPQTVHGQATKRGEQGVPECAVCHGVTHEVARTASFDARKQSIETCGMCHSEQLEQFQKSVHGQAIAKGIPDAPGCSNCHEVHLALPPQSKNTFSKASQIRETCAGCHADLRLASRFGIPPDRIVSFDQSFHGLALKAGSQTVANCSSCHGFHEIRNSKDPLSMVHPQNLAATCGRCHEGAGTRFALGTVHWTEGQQEPVGVGWIRLIYSVAIPLIIGLMVLHNGGDFVRKVFSLRLAKVAVPDFQLRASARQFRMHGAERVQHALLVVSFVALAVSGFALRYPDAWWAKPWVSWEASISLRGIAHRTAAVVFIVVSVAHVVSLIVSRRLREHWKELLPRGSDVREAFTMFMWNLGIIRQRPMVASHGYIEKAEYWAVVWGAALMAVTGIGLWGNQFMLQYWPKAVLDAFSAIHFYEAVLATLSILVWHFYFVLFDPEVYPMDPAWLTGYSVRSRALSEGPSQPVKSGDD